jgi:glucosamine kinase
VLVADEQGTPLGSADGGGCAVRPGEEERSAEVIAGYVREALAASGVEDKLPAVLCVGVAGAGREPQREALRKALMERELAEEVIVLPDAAVALEDAFGDGPGILLIAGTGSVAFGRSPTGIEDRCGGWGPYIGDEGSGIWIGRRALSVVTAATDGREPDTALVGALLTAAEVNEPSELIAWATAATGAQLASLAPVVVSTAEAGDLRANSILSLAAEELVLHISTLARRLFQDERATCPVALGGGLLSPGSFLRRRVEQRLKSAVPGATLRSEEVNPVRGAVRAGVRWITAGGRIQEAGFRENL